MWPMWQSFCQLGDFKRHINNVHERLKNHKCDLCDKNFGYSQTLKRHIESVYERMKKHKCKLCEKAFSQVADLKRHINSVHERLRNHKCNQCGRVFNQEWILRITLTSFMINLNTNVTFAINLFSNHKHSRDI